MIRKLFDAVKIAGIAVAIVAVCGLLLVGALWDECFYKKLGDDLTRDGYEE